MHIPELEKALTELARVLKPGGVLVLCENNGWFARRDGARACRQCDEEVGGQSCPRLRKTPSGTKLG